MYAHAHAHAHTYMHMYVHRLRSGVDLFLHNLAPLCLLNYNHITLELHFELQRKSLTEPKFK